MAHSRRKLDLTGQKMGRLTAIKPMSNIGKKTAWLCRCDCGKEKIVKTDHLRSGHTSSCGGCRRTDAPAAGPLVTYVDGTCIEMLRAKTVRSNNTSGVPGVDWRAGRGTWRASICFKGKRYHLGSFAFFEDAVKARKEAEESLHDRFLDEFAKSSVT